MWKLDFVLSCVCVLQFCSLTEICNYSASNVKIKFFLKHLRLLAGDVEAAHREYVFMVYFGGCTDQGLLPGALMKIFIF